MNIVDPSTWPLTTAPVDPLRPVGDETSRRVALPQTAQAILTVLRDVLAAP